MLWLRLLIISFFLYEAVGYLFLITLAISKPRFRAFRLITKVVSKTVKWKNKLRKLPKSSGRGQIGFVVNPPAKEYDPCASGTMCENEAECLNNDGQFFCECQPGFYGQRCENEASNLYCKHHNCLHGNCYSIADEVEALNMTAMKILRKKYKDKDEIPQHELDQEYMQMKIKYRCQCHLGWVGTYCDMSEDEQRCTENFCLHNGRGRLINETCVCECDPGYTGEQCDVELPCNDWDCMNGGKCIDQFDNATNSYTAVCECMDGEPVGIKVTVNGTQCEALDITESEVRNDTLNVPGNPLLPCIGAQSMEEWLGAVRKTNVISAVDKQKILTMKSQCRQKLLDKGNHAELTSCENSTLFKAGFCYNDAICMPWIHKLESGKYFIIPYCHCTETSTSGTFCEFRRRDVCDTTFDEHVRGVTIENRCTSKEHGKCNPFLGDGTSPVCDCNPGWTGERCQTWDPCASKPCGEKAECIPLDPTEVNGQSTKSFRCICDMGAESDGPNRCSVRTSGNCTAESCVRGSCVDCSSTEHVDMEICGLQERKAGYRCVCEPGYTGFRCDIKTGPCYRNLCENQSVCRNITATDYECICHPGTNGRLCENIMDACIMSGNSICSYGKCVPSYRSRRSFECECSAMYEGRDCDMEMSITSAIARHAMRYHALSLGSIFVLLVGSLLIFTQCCLAKTTDSVREGREHQYIQDAMTEADAEKEGADDENEVEESNNEGKDATASSTNKDKGEDQKPEQKS